MTSEITDYIAAQPADIQPKLRQFYDTIRAAAPNASERIAHRMPCYYICKTFLCGFAAFKNHIGFYPGSEPVNVFAESLAKYKTSKGTVQFEVGMMPILTEACYPAAIFELLKDIRQSAWADRIYFWRREEEGEPDIIIELDNAVILIEVKLFSWLSSDDSVDNSSIEDEAQYNQSANQLSKYAQTLTRIANGRDKYLILLAPMESAHKIYADVSERKLIPADTRFGYITWQGMFDSLSRIEAYGFHQTIIGDLINLLKIKGFAGFKNFNVEAEIDNSSGWSIQFGTDTVFDFAFADTIPIMENGCYEFR